MVSILLCYYGVISRSIRYTHESIKKNILDILKEKYNVDVYVFNFNIEDNLIDGYKVEYSDINYINYNYYEEEKQNEFDKEINEKYNDILNQIFYYKQYYNNVVNSINALKQLYTEYKVGCFIEKNKNNYDIVIATCSDNYFCNKFNLEDIDDCIENKNVIYITPMNDAGGYTNAFYYGNTDKIIILLKRFSFIIENKCFLHRDYEFYVKFIMDIYNIERRYSNLYYFKIKNNKNIFWNNNNYNYNFFKLILNDKTYNYDDLNLKYNELKKELESENQS